MAVNVAGFDIARDGGTVSLRPATEADAELMFIWQCDDRTRRYARNPSKPNWEGHVSWVKRYLATDGRLFIIQHNKADAGILRLDPEPDGSHEVTVVIAPKFYRVGAAVPALRVARAQIKTGLFTAEVLTGNEASHRMLIEAGYEDRGGGQYVQQPFTERP